MKITTKRFLDCIRNYPFMIKKTNGITISLSNTWTTEGRVMGMFFDFQQKDKKEYIKIYLDNQLRQYPNLRIDIYLLHRGKKCGLDRKGKPMYMDLFLKSFSDFEVFKDFFINLPERISNVKY